MMPTLKQNMQIFPFTGNYTTCAKISDTVENGEDTLERLHIAGSLEACYYMAFRIELHFFVRISGPACIPELLRV